MSKRELEFDTGTGESGGSRQKRRREAEGTPDIDVIMSDPPEHTKLNSDIITPEEVKEQGMKLFAAVRDATKEDRSMALVFLRKVPKRQYPDYYALIKQPIAMDDIKKKLDHEEYISLEAVRSDFELMFNNAKQYNQTDSFIYQDAKELMKLVNKTYQKLIPGDDDENKHKPPTLHRLMKTRLDKLINKKDPSGRVLSTEFMYLPSRKEWAIYYKQIKKPQCLDTIQKNIKRKEYHTSAQFAADVELVFSNATTFNQDGTQIWIDAVTLRDYFRQLMSDMPPPHSLPEYAKLATTTKIKIRPPHAAHAAESTSGQLHPKNDQHTSSILLRVPAAHPPKPTTTLTAPAAVPSSAPPAPAPPPAQPSPAPPVAAKPASKAAPKLKPAPPAQPTPIRPQRTTVQQQAQVKAATPQAPQAVSFINANASHYPRSHYAPPPPPAPAAGPATSSAPSTLPHKPAANIVTASQSPAPVVLPLSHQLKSIEVRIQPGGRFVTLDHRDGVKSWFLRLVPGESRVNIGGIAFMGDPDEEESSDDEEEKEKEDEDYDMDIDVEAGSASPSKNLRSKGKRGRGRPLKPAVKVTPTKAPKKKQPKIGEVQLKLNSIVVKEQIEHEGEWDVYLPVGSSVVEVGEVGGMTWKLYLERLGES